MIFICYRRGDTGDLAQYLAAQLSEHFGERNVFLDRQHIEAGERWPEEIENALSQAVVLLALIGREWLTSYDEYGQRRIDRDDDVLAREICTALQRKVRVIPLYVHGVEPLPAKAFPPRIAALAEQQAIECADVKDISPILAALDGVPGLHRQGKVRGNWGLPPAKPDFTGRDAESTQITEEINKHGRRTVIICGLPGTGKTEMALHAAELLRESFPDGAIFCDLRGFKDSPLSPADAARSVLLSMNPELKLPPQEEQVFAHYFSALSGKRILLVFDDAKDTAQVERLLPPTPAAVLVTSRRTIDIPNALRVRLDRFTADEAIGFLRKLNGRVLGAEEKLAAACGRLPLALRLAASALEKRPSLELDRYIALLADAAGRSRYLPALQVQFDLLTDSARPRLTALTIFQNGFTDEGACAVWGVNEVEGDSILVDLYDLSLVVWLPARRRYVLHDIIRQFACDVSGGALGEGTEQRYSDYMLKVTKELKERFLKGGADLTASLAMFDEFDSDIVNALQWAVAHAGSDPNAARTCADLAWECWYLFEHRRGFNALATLADIGVQASQAIHDEERRMAHTRRKGFIQARDAPEAALTTLAACLSHARERSNRREEGIVMGYIGLACQKLNRYAEAAESFSASLTIARQLGDKRRIGIALGRLASMHESKGELAEAARLFEQALSVEREIDDRPGSVIDGINCGRVFEKCARLEEAEAHYITAATTAHDLGDARELTALAWLCDLRSNSGSREAARDHCAVFRDALLDAVRKGKVYLANVCSSLIDERRWTAASVVADCMIQHEPSDVSGWTEKAYAVRRMPSAGIAAATEILMEARKRFPTAWVVPYNLACYAAQTDKRAEAVQWLKEAIEVSGDAQAIKVRAAADSDLECLGPTLAEL